MGYSPLDHTDLDTTEATWHACMKVKGKSLSRVRLCDPMDCSLPGSSIHGIFQARILEHPGKILKECRIAKVTPQGMRCAHQGRF